MNLANDLKSKKKKLESEVSALLNEFQEGTGLVCSGAYWQVETHFESHEVVKNIRGLTIEVTL